MKLLLTLTFLAGSIIATSIDEQANEDHQLRGRNLKANDELPNGRPFQLIGKELSLLQGDIDLLEDDLKVIKTRVDTLEVSVQANFDLIEGLTADFEQLQTDLEADLEVTNERIQSLADDLAATKLEYEANSEEFMALIADLQTTIGEINSQIADILVAINVEGTDFGTIAAGLLKVTELQNKLATLEEAKEDLETEVADLKVKVADLDEFEEEIKLLLNWEEFAVAPTSFSERLCIWDYNGQCRYSYYLCSTGYRWINYVWYTPTMVTELPTQNFDLYDWPAPSSFTVTVNGCRLYHRVYLNGAQVRSFQLSSYCTCSYQRQTFQIPPNEINEHWNVNGVNTIYVRTSGTGYIGEIYANIAYPAPVLKEGMDDGI